MRRHLALIVLAALPPLVAGCDKSGEYATSFSTKPLVATSDSVGGHAFTIQLPEGVVKGSELLGGQHFTTQKAISGFDQYGPDVEIRYVPGAPSVKSLSSAFGQKTVSRKDESPGSVRVTLTDADKTLVLARTAKATDSGYLQCEYKQEVPKGQKDYDALVAFGEKVCDSLSPSAPAAAKAAVAGPADPGQAASAVPAVTPEMQQFLGAFGSAASVGKGLEKWGKAGLETHDMELYDLKSPKVVAGTASGARTCYTVEAAGGLLTYTYGVCWEKGKIVTIEDKGSR